MKVIGLCGGSGSGKGTVSSILKKHGIPSIDTDAVYREMTSGDSPCMQALKESFGNDIVNADGGLDRGGLAAVVFGDAEKLKLLNRIAHSFILDETRRLLDEYRSAGYAAAIVDAPVLYESGFDSECDEVVCVVADTDVRVRRIIQRDGISLDAAMKRIQSQMSNEELISRSHYVINNNGNLEELSSEVDKLAKIILEN